MTHNNPFMPGVMVHDFLQSCVRNNRKWGTYPEDNGRFVGPEMCLKILRAYVIIGNVTPSHNKDVGKVNLQF